MATLGQYYIQVNPSAEGISGKLKGLMDPAASSAGESAGKSLGTQIASFAAKAIAALGVGKMIKDSIMAGADLEQSIGGIETLFGAGGAKTVEEFAKTAGKSVGEVREEYNRLMEAENQAMTNAAKAWQTSGLSANDYMQTVTGFAAALKQSTDSELEAVRAADTAVIDMADNANKMGTDMSSIQMAYQGFAKQNYTMLDNLKLGYGGTKTEMERLLKDATALSGVEYNLDSLSDVYAAIHVIQEDLGITGTTAKEAASTFSGSMSAMKASAENLMANLSLGNDISADLGNLTDAFFTWAGNLVPMVGNILKGLPAVVSTALSGITQGLNQMLAGLDSGNLVETGARMIGDLVSGIVTALPYIAEAAVSIIGKIGEQFMTTDWRGIASDLLSSLKNGLDLASGEIFGSDKNILQAIMDGITENLPSLLDKGVEIIGNIVNGILSALPEMIATAGSLVSSFAGFILRNLPVIMQKGGDLIRSLISGIVQNLPQIATSAFQAITRFRVTIMENLPGLLTAGLSLIGEIVAGIIQAIPGLIASIPQVVSGIADTIMSHNWLEIGWNIISGIVDGLLSAGAAILDAVISVCSPILDELDLTEDIATIWENIKTAIFEKWEAIRLVVSTAAENVWTVITEKFEAARAAVATAIGAALTNITQTFNNIVTTVAMNAESVRTTVQEKFDAARIRVTEIVENLKNAIAERFRIILSTVTEKATAIYTTAKQKFDDMKRAVTDTLSILVTNVATKVQEIWTKISTKFSEVVTTARTKFEEVRTEVVNKLTTLVTNVGTKVQEIWKKISDKFREIVTEAGNKFEEVKKAVLDKVGALASALPGKLADIGRVFSDTFSGLARDALTWGRDIIQGIVDGINQKLQAVRDAASSVAGAVKSILGFSEPEEGPLSDFHTYMPDMIALMVKGINEGIPKIRDAASGLAMEIRPELDTSYMRRSSNYAAGNQSANFTQNLTINSPKELSHSETARLNRIALQSTALKMRMA